MVGSWQRVAEHVPANDLVVVSDYFSVAQIIAYYTLELFSPSEIVTVCELLVFRHYAGDLLFWMRGKLSHPDL